MSQEKLQTNDYAKFWRIKEVYYGICASGEYYETNALIVTGVKH